GVHLRRGQDRQGRLQGLREGRADDTAREARCDRVQGDPGPARQTARVDRAQAGSGAVLQHRSGGTGDQPRPRFSADSAAQSTGEVRLAPTPVRPPRPAGALVVAGSAVGSAAAYADEIDNKLDAYDNEARQLSTEIPRPNQISGPAGQRRLLDAEVAYSLGD